MEKDRIQNSPCAAKGYISYRCRGTYEWIMIGAKDPKHAFSEALRTCKTAKRGNLEVWDGNKYVPC
jgi:hypothetical protein